MWCVYITLCTLLYCTDSSLFSKHMFASSLKWQKSKNATYYNLYVFSHVLLALWWCLPVCVLAAVVLRSVGHKMLAVLFWHLIENPQQTRRSNGTTSEQKYSTSDVFRRSLSTHKTRTLFTTSGLRSSEMLHCDVWWVVPCMSPSSSDLQWFKVHED